MVLIPPSKSLCPRHRRRWWRLFFQRRDGPQEFGHQVGHPLPADDLAPSRAHRFRRSDIRRGRRAGTSAARLRGNRGSSPGRPDRSGAPPDGLIECVDLGGRVAVVLGEGDTGSHVQQVADRRAAVAAIRQCRNKRRAGHLQVDLTGPVQRAPTTVATNDLLTEAEGGEDRRSYRAVLLGHDLIPGGRQPSRRCRWCPSPRLRCRPSRRLWSAQLGQWRWGRRQRRDRSAPREITAVGMTSSTCWNDHRGRGFQPVGQRMPAGAGGSGADHARATSRDTSGRPRSRGGTNLA